MKETCRSCLGLYLSFGAFSLSLAQSGVDEAVPEASIDEPELQLIIRTAPRYPEDALARKLTGSVVVEFTVSEQGKVVEPEVIDSSSVIFEEPALRAVERYRYLPPKTSDGSAMQVPGVQTEILFEIEENSAPNERTAEDLDAHSARD